MSEPPKNTRKRQAFIESLEIENPAPPVGKDDCFVCGGSLVSFVANLKDQQKNDVLNSSLLAQLAANKKFDREKDTINWYRFYTQVMENVGWVIQGFKFTNYQSSQASFSLSQVTLQILSGIIGVTNKKEIMNVVKATLDGLSKSTEGARLFDSKSAFGNYGNFQIMPCQTDDSGQVTMALMGFYFEANRQVGNFFFYEWNKQDMNLYSGTQACTLNEEIYATVRDAVVKKLGEKAKNEVKNLDI